MARKPWSPQSRTALIALIHVAKRDLGMDEDTYRAALTTATQKASTKDMTAQELQAVLDHLKRKGFQIKPKAATRPLADDAQSKKIRALWLEMHAQGIVKAAGEAALANYVKRLTRVDALQWLSTDQASTVIETLKKWQRRELAKKAA